jgi:uncharacterized protein YozE (UPF0346 family)
MIYFKTWLKNFLKEDSAFGDLAKDVADDSEFPKQNKYDIILYYLQRQNAISDCITTFENAWREYKYSNLLKSRISSRYFSS